MSERLQEALEWTLDVYAAISEPEVADAEAEVRNAARRFLHLTETGPDYEAAARTLFRQVFGEDAIGEIPLVQRKQARAIVDAALADYLPSDPT